jgi:hypothetical protein
MLSPQRHSSFGFTYDNWGTNPSSTPGTSIVPGASNAEGSWTQVATGANIAADVYGLSLQVFGGATSATAKNHLLDIGVDPAGGTSYTAVISNLQVGSSPALTVAGAREYFFWFYIPAGASVAVRVQGNQATAGTVRVVVRFYGRPKAPEMVPRGSFSETFGTITNSNGQSVTPGNAADGSWTLLGTTTQDLWWWQLGYGIDNATVTAEYTYIELAFGDVSNKVTIFKMMHVGTTGETAGLAMQTQLVPAAAYQPVPAGAGIYVRMRCNNAPDTGYHVTVVGIGG